MCAVLQASYHMKTLVTRSRVPYSHTPLRFKNMSRRPLSNRGTVRIAGRQLDAILAVGMARMKIESGDAEGSVYRFVPLPKGKAPGRGPSPLPKGKAPGRGPSPSDITDKLYEQPQVCRSEDPDSEDSDSCFSKELLLDIDPGLLKLLPDLLPNDDSDDVMPTPVINRTTEKVTRYELFPDEARAQLLNELDQQEKIITQLRDKKIRLQAELKRKVSALFALDDIKCDDPAVHLRNVFTSKIDKLAYPGELIEIMVQMHMFFPLKMVKMELEERVALLSAKLYPDDTPVLLQEPEKALYDRFCETQKIPEQYSWQFVKDNVWVPVRKNMARGDAKRHNACNTALKEHRLDTDTFFRMLET